MLLFIILITKRSILDMYNVFIKVLFVFYLSAIDTLQLHGVFASVVCHFWKEECYRRTLWLCVCNSM